MAPAWREARARQVTLLASLGIVLSVHLGLAPPSEAITRQRAEAIALKILKPPAKNAGKRVTVAVFGLRAPLGRKAIVTVGGPRPNATGSRVRRTHRARRLGARTWLFWRDSRYGARFSHPSVLLLIDDRTGRVRTRKKLAWWPLVNGRKPAFLRNARNYASKRFLVYSDLQLGKGPAVAAAASTAALAPDWATASKAPPGVFAKDCLLTLYNRDDDRFLADVQGMEEVATEAGIRTFRVEARKKWQPPNAADLRRATSEVVAKGCKDVLLYVTAHGTEAGSTMLGERVNIRTTPTGGVTVTVDDTLISGAQITRAIADQVQNATFKVKFDTCYAGHQLQLLNLPNVLIVETSSQADEPSYFHVDEALRRGGDRQLYVLRNTRNAHGRGEFTNRNVVGLQRFFERPDEIQHGLQQAQAQGTSLLAWALSRAFSLGENADFAATLGWTDPQMGTRFQPSPPD